MALRVMADGSVLIHRGDATVHVDPLGRALHVRTGSARDALGGILLASYVLEAVEGVQVTLEHGRWGGQIVLKRGEAIRLGRWPSLAEAEATAGAVAELVSVPLETPGPSGIRGWSMFAALEPHVGIIPGRGSSGSASPALQASTDLGALAQGVPRAEIRYFVRVPGRFAEPSVQPVMGAGRGLVRTIEWAVPGLPEVPSDVVAGPPSARYFRPVPGRLLSLRASGATVESQLAQALDPDVEKTEPHEVVSVAKALNAFESETTQPHDVAAVAQLASTADVDTDATEPHDPSLSISEVQDELSSSGVSSSSDVDSAVAAPTSDLLQLDVDSAPPLAEPPALTPFPQVAQDAATRPPAWSSPPDTLIEPPPLTPTTALEPPSFTPSPLQMPRYVTPIPTLERPFTPHPMLEPSVTPAPSLEPTWVPDGPEESLPTPAPSWAPTPSPFGERSQPPGSVGSRALTPSLFEERLLTPSPFEARALTPSPFDERSLTPSPFDERSLTPSPYDRPSFLPPSPAGDRFAPVPPPTRSQPSAPSLAPPFELPPFPESGDQAPSSSGRASTKPAESDTPETRHEDRMARLRAMVGAWKEPTPPPRFPPRPPSSDDLQSSLPVIRRPDVPAPEVSDSMPSLAGDSAPSSLAARAVIDSDPTVQPDASVPRAHPLPGSEPGWALSCYEAVSDEPGMSDVGGPAPDLPAVRSVVPDTADDNDDDEGPPPLGSRLPSFKARQRSTAPPVNHKPPAILEIPGFNDASSRQNTPPPSRFPPPPRGASQRPHSRDVPPRIASRNASPRTASASSSGTRAIPAVTRPESRPGSPRPESQSGSPRSESRQAMPRLGSSPPPPSSGVDPRMVSAARLELLRQTAEDLPSASEDLARIRPLRRN